jgi:hypothetical protein
MPRISELNLNQINRQFDILDTVQSQIKDTQSAIENVKQSIDIADPIHAPITTNNINATWTGGTGVLSWPQAFIKDKNWNAQTLASPAAKSSVKGQQHIHTIPAGSLVLQPSTYYWLGWDVSRQRMLALTDASQLHGNYNIHVLCQIYTGTVGQTGLAGGGGSNGGVDFSGARYKNF